MTTLFRHGYVRAAGPTLVDDDGPLTLRGIGLGNWLLPEGYMWLFGDALASPRDIEARITDLVGLERAAQFWRRFHDEFITEVDFAMIARAGFDHVRLPINARGVMREDGTWIDEGFELIERAVRWSEQVGLRILLDLHGAPGGQTGTNIDDSRHNLPELFMDSRYRAQTIALWSELARRYRDRTAVLGYDLLNEPLPNEWQHRYERELVELYRELTTAIRDIDDRHALVYEGSHWATNWSPLKHRFDDNQVLQFHRYWCPPEESSIAEYLETRDRLNTPIYMGEGGENTPEWIYAMTRLYERYDIGWNFWPWKKLDTLTSPLSAVRPEGWELIADPLLKPARDEAWEVLCRFLEAIPARKCIPRTEVMDALFARPALRLPAWAATRDGSAITLSGRALGDLPATLWEHTFGQPYDQDENHPVPLKQGATLAFALSEQPEFWSVDADAPHALAAAWNGRELVLEATSDVRVKALLVGKADSVKP